MARILLVDDDAGFADATASVLEMLGHAVDTAGTVADARTLLSRQRYDRVFLDLLLPDGSGFHLLGEIPTGSTLVTLITGHPAVKKQVMNLYGLHVNYLVKPISLDQLKSLFEDKQQRENAAGITWHFGELIGETPVMQELYRQIERVGASNANVMLTGESGVGKELVARAVHKASRVSGPFVAANCGAMSPELISSELFGHEKGAFTGAVNRRVGLFEEAQDGTLFLDEVTEMPLSMQANLLRVLETRTVIPLGTTNTIPVNCRVVSATNRTEEQIVDSNCLREDIYYRLAVFPLHIPPLRERMADVPLLVKGFIDNLNRENGTRFILADSELKRLQSYDWPGNVRELRHVLHRAWIMADPEEGVLRLPERFDSPFSRRKSAQPLKPELAGRTIEEVERQLIMQTLERFENNKTKAAEALGVSVKTLYNRLSSYGVEDANQGG